MSIAQEKNPQNKGLMVHVSRSRLPNTTVPGNCGIAIGFMARYWQPYKVTLP
jgi:hypothetical protein